VHWWAAIVIAMTASAPAGAATVDTLQPVPQAGVGTLGWSSAGQLWAVSPVSSAVQRGVLRHGRVRWASRGEIGGVTGWRALATGEDGATYAAGTMSIGRSPVGAVARLDPETGAVSWLRRTAAPAIGLARRRGGGIFVLTRSTDGERQQIVPLSVSGRPDRPAITLPVSLPNAPFQRPLTVDSHARPTVLGYTSDERWRTATLVGTSWVLRDLHLSDDPLSSLAPSERGLWVFGDAGDSGGAVAELTADATVPVMLPPGTDGSACSTLSFGRAGPAFHGAGVAGPDGALWLRAGCFTDDLPDGPAVWLRVVPGGTNAELVPAGASASLSGVSSMVVGPDHALWSLDLEVRTLIRTVVPGAPTAPAATVRWARRTGRRVGVGLACVEQLGRVCAGTVRVTRGARTVASGTYMIDAGPTTRRPWIVRTLTIPTRDRGASLRIVVSGRAAAHPVR
jgi:hypothetical protein